jgi:hypothetical protein
VAVTVCRAGPGWIGGVTYVVRVGAALAGLAAAGLLAACGGHATANSPATAASGGFQAYADCLRQHGVAVEVPTARPSGTRPTDRPTARPSGVRPSGRGGGFPGFGGAAPSGVDPSTWDAAQQACASLRPSLGGGNGGRGGNNGAITAYRNCLRDHGVTASTGPEALNTADPKVAAAMQACAPLRPTARPS